MLKKYMQFIRAGGLISFDQACEIAKETPADELYEGADELRRIFHNEDLDLCSIVNAKSGKCSEDCKFCAQSSFYDVDIETYDVIETEKAVSMARENDQAGVKRFSLVTAGKTVSESQIRKYGEIFAAASQNTEMSFCASMGMLTASKAELLKSFGVSRYHCNLEACKRYFPKICTTHTWEEKVETIKIAQKAGMEVCSGGIIGMGESLRHRMQLAFELRDLAILSVPINILTPIPDTPFSELEPISIDDILTCVAMFRIIHPRAVIRLAGGRGQMGEDQSRCFTSGANGAIVGNYLTTAGNSLDQDREMFSALGFTLSAKPESL